MSRPEGADCRILSISGGVSLSQDHRQVTHRHKEKAAYMQVGGERIRESGMMGVAFELDYEAWGG